MTEMCQQFTYLAIATLGTRGLARYRVNAGCGACWAQGRAPARITVQEPNRMIKSSAQLRQITLAMGLAFGAAGCSTISDLDPTGLLSDSSDSAPASQFPDQTAPTAPDQQVGTTPQRRRPGALRPRSARWRHGTPGPGPGRQ